VKNQTMPTQLNSKLVRAFLVVTLVIGAGIFSPIADAKKKELPPVSPEGLKLVPNTKVSAVYMRDGANFSGYDKVAILDCYVAFVKDWKRDQNDGANPFKVSDKDVTRIRTELAAMFKDVFGKSLTAKGETLTTTGGTGVLILRPAILNLDVTAPDTMDPGSRTFSASAGTATLYLELLDGVSGELLMRVMDAEEAGDYGLAQVRNSVTNRSDAERMLKKWADRLGVFLQNARASAGGVPTPPAKK